MAHISRRELKKDEFRETLAHGAEAVLTHRQIFASVTVVAVLVLIAVFGWKFYTERQVVKASATFAQAMQVFQAPLRSANQPSTPGEISYLQAKSKYEDAAKKFEDVANRYPRTRQGQLARYYAALSLEQLGQNDQAVKWLEGLANGRSADFGAMGRFALAEIYDRSGKGTQALQLYQQLMARPSVLVPKPMVMLAMAEHYRQTNPAEAARIYNQLKSEYPDSSAADQADQALAMLPGKS